MKILWMTWKDIGHPLAGGAEVVADEIATRLVKDGHEVTLLTAHYPGVDSIGSKNGYNIIRTGGTFSVYYHAYRYYKAHLAGKYDLVIDEMNTIPFFARFYVKEKNVMFVHQLAREIWFYQMFFPLSVIGYIIEPLYVRLLSKNKVITISESTKSDLVRLGFKDENTTIISEGVHTPAVENLESIEKYSDPTLLYFGSLRPMKRPDQVLKAFEIAKDYIPNLKFIIAGGGSGKYADALRTSVQKSSYKADITLTGRVDDAKRDELMELSHVIAVASVREGWGLIVTEAARRGTPAAVYPVPGLRDAVRHGETGRVASDATPASLAKEIVYMFEHKDDYDSMRNAAWEWSKEITFDKQYQDFLKAITSL